MSETVLTLGFLMKTPITPRSLSQAQKDALHTVLHVFPGSTLLWEDGRELPLRITKKPGCLGCEG